MFFVIVACKKQSNLNRYKKTVITKEEKNLIIVKGNLEVERE